MGGNTSNQHVRTILLAAFGAAAVLVAVFFVAQQAALTIAAP